MVQIVYLLLLPSSEVFLLSPIANMPKVMEPAIASSQGLGPARCVSGFFFLFLLFK